MGNVNNVKQTKRKPNNRQSDYFQSHKCSLSLDKMNADVIECGRLRRCFLHWTTVNTNDVRALRMYRSYASLKAEQYRQYTYYPCSVHPFSKLRIWFEAILALIIMFSNCFLAVHYISAHYEGPRAECMALTVTDDMIYIALIVINFLTGYIEGDSCPRVVLDLKKIAKKYARSWFIVDLAIVLSPAAALIKKSEIIIRLCIDSLKILRSPLLFNFFKNVLIYHKAGILLMTLFEMFFLIFSYILWNIYFQFVTEYIIEDSFVPENPRNCSWLSGTKLWNGTLSAKFVYALHRSVCMLRQNPSKMLEYENYVCSEAFIVIFWLIGKMIIVHCTLKYIIMLISSESARAKYLMMAQQLETYMNQRKFPSKLKKKIIQYYSIKFQSHFFVESRMMECVSGQLKEDLIMFICRQLVGDVPFLKTLPRQLLLQIAIKLKLVIFMSGDIIFKINTIGDCLYFIDKGTVAIYSESGKEICHLDDGDVFGEIALVMPENMRTTSAVAVSNCELFCLSKEDFERSIACYPTVYDNLKKLATDRMYQTLILNDHHKAETKMIQDHYMKQKSF